MTTTNWWRLYFNGSSTAPTRRAGVMLSNPVGQATTIFLQLTFLCTNNIAEYEALLFGLVMTRSLRANIIKVIGDSKLVIN